MKTSMLSRFAVILLAAASPQLAHAQLPQVPAPENPQSDDAWRTLVDADLTYLDQVVQSAYIYSQYPDPKAFEKVRLAALNQARIDAKLAHSFGGYRAVLQRYLAEFQDAHFSAYFNVFSKSANWPGFRVKYTGGGYVVSNSALPAVHDGETISSCDGRTLNNWTDTLAPYFSGPPGRETTRAGIAEQFMIDRGNPLYKLPQNCVIAGHDVALQWTPAPETVVPPEPERTSSSAATVNDETVAVRDIGNNIAWIRMGTMLPFGVHVAEFQSLIKSAPSLRDKDAVIIDVRGNGGGNYNWFMAFLRAFYGDQYADYYARARLEVSNVIMTPPAKMDASVASYIDQGGGDTTTPHDPPLEAAQAASTKRSLPNGGQLEFWPAPIKTLRYASTAPKSPVGARVYVLTDYGCGSACIAFLDEMMRFPGVTLIGAESHVDRRSGGWPMGYDLPSGLAVVRMGRMVRDGRARGDNEAWVPGPGNHFPGDIADTNAVEKWIVTDVLPRDAKNTGKWSQTATLQGAVSIPAN